MMEASATPGGAAERLSRLMNFLEADPANLPLLADAAAAALDAAEPALAGELLDRYAAADPLTPALLNLKGLAALGRHDFAAATRAFEDLMALGYDDPAIRFNLAFCRAMGQDYAGALDMLEDATAVALPQAAAMKIEMLHHLGRLEDALACGLGLAERQPDNQPLMGALSSVALDAEDLELARFYAERAGERTEGLSTLGMLLLGEEDIEASMGLFDRALAAQPDNGRALVGKGLGLLARGENLAAADLLDRGAEIFGHHLGSWVAAAWARFVNGDSAGARARFERALALDDTFAETHGGLAVLDLMEGQMDSARRRTEIALRLDRTCFSAALAQSLLLSSEGDHAKAERIRQIAMNVPIGASGKTIAQAMASLGARTGRGGN